MAKTMFITTIPMALDLRASLDVIRAERAKKTGSRNTVKSLIIEALSQFVEREQQKSQ